MELKAFECLRVTGGAVAQIVITRPKALNALNRQVLVELQAALHQLQRDPDIRCLIITGEGTKAFVAGADIAEMAAMSPVEAEEFAALGQSVFDQLETFPTPTLAAVNGFALGGGCELVLACDLVYAAENAKFGQPEVKLGLMPGFGGTVRLPRKIGLSAACEWIFTGELVSAHGAKEAGLVREVLSAADLHGRVQEVAQLIAKRAPLAVRAAKRVMVQEADKPLATTLERWNFSRLFGSADTREGTQAFMEKREPAFKGE